MQESLNANTTNERSKQRSKQTWQENNEQCAQMPQAKHMPTNMSSAAQGVWWGFLFYSWAVMLVLKELIEWWGFWFCLWEVLLAEWHKVGAVRVHLMLSPVVCRAWEEKNPSLT
jgi:hypothetical protein